MRNGITKLLLTLLMMLCALPQAIAQNISFQINAPRAVALGERFNAQFSLNATADSGTFEAPSFEGFDILAGPMSSRSTSMTFINGKRESKVENIYTYTLLPQKAGTHTIGAAKIKADGKSYTTKPLPIEVVDEGGNTAQNQSQNRGQSHASQSTVSSDDIMLRMIVSRRSVFKGEPLRATLKLYTRVAVVGSDGEKLPSFNGFWSQKIESNSGKVERETYNGKVYDTRVITDYLLYPQQSGKLIIEPAEIDAIVQIITRSNRGGDPFFGGGHEVSNVKRKISTPRIEIDVKSLPVGAPASFGGAVGEFTIESSLSQQQIVANSASSYNLKVSGRGNLTFVQAPKLSLPTSFEQYNVKFNESISTTENGTVGYKAFEYPFIARAQGEFEIPAVEFSYFNPKTAKYVTLTTQSFPMDIAPDNSEMGDTIEPHVLMGLSRDDVKLLGQDIRFIHLGDPKLESEFKPLMLSTTYFLILAIVALIFIGLFIILRRQISDSHNAALMRGKRANKVAIQRFKSARQFMDAANERQFYEEMHRALWGYMSDKFNIPVANLTRETVREELTKRSGVAAERAAQFSEIITKCDEAQYSPMASAQMHDIYTGAVDYISNIETETKR